MTWYARYLWRFVGSILLPLLFCESATARTWTDATGKFSVDAEFVSLDSGVLTLKEKDGSTISLPMEKLCKEDQDQAKQLAAASDKDNPFVKATTIAPDESKTASATPQVAGENAIDLLAQVKLPDDAVMGNWKKTNDGIASDPNGRTILRLSDRPDGEYDFRISFTCKGKTGGVSQICSFKGTSFEFCVGGHDNTVCGFAHVDGRNLPDNPPPTIYRSGITTNRRHEVVVKVRNESVTGYLDGSKICELKTDYTNITIGMGAEVGPGKLGISTLNSQTIFHSIEVIPVESIPSNTTQATPSKTYIRLSLAVMEYGDCYVKVEETSAPISSATKFDGETATLSRFQNAEILRSADGGYRIIHSFDHPEPLDKIFFAVQGVEENGFGDALLFKTGKDVYSQTMYWSRCQLPMIVCYDLLTIPNQSGINLKIDSLHLGSLRVNLSKSKDAKTMLDISWFDMDQDKKYVNHTQRFGPAEVDPANGFQHKFRLPLPNARIENVSQIQIRALSDLPKKTEFAHLLVQGRLYPVVGIEFKEKSSVVFVSRVSPDSICEKAGLQEGDVVVSYNGQEPKSAALLEDTTNEVPLGDTLTFKIKRGDQEKDIKVTAE